MPETPTIHSHRIERQMDHFIMALKVDPASDEPSFLLSLYWIGYEAAAAPGHVAFVSTTGADGAPSVEAVLTDEPALVETMGDRLRPRGWPDTDPIHSGRPASFVRSTRLTPSGRSITFRVEADGLTIDARWDALSTPVFATGPTPSGARITTLLIESLEPSAEVDGRRQPGDSFRNPIWTPWFGDERGSCVIGLGETIYAV